MTHRYEQQASREGQRRFEEISAYVDGQADDPALVEQWLREDAASAAAYAQLKRLRHAAGQLPEPEPSAAFATRVMAHIREEGAPAGRGRHWAWLTISATTLAAVLAVGMAAFLLFTGQEGITDAERFEAARYVEIDPDALEETLTTQLEQEFAASGASDPLNFDSPFDAHAGWMDEPGLPGTQPETGERLAAVAGAALEVIEADMTLEDILASLTPAEREAFGQLLAEQI